MKRFKNILCVVERVEECAPALERAVALAAANGAELTVVDVVERIAAGGIESKELHSTHAGMQTGMVQASLQALEALVEPYRDRVPVETKALLGTPYLEIIREVQRYGRDLIIKIAEKQDWLDRLLGCADMSLLRNCPCPVLIVRSPVPQPYRRVVAAVDTDSGYPLEELSSRHGLNVQVFELASSLALADSAELHVVHAWHAVGESAMHGAFMHSPEEKIRAYVEQVRGQQSANLDRFLCEMAVSLGQAMEDLKPRVHLLEGFPRKAIPALVKEIGADLIVMGSVARTGVPGFIIGNTAEVILCQINCSVLAIKPPGFVSPVAAAD